MKPSWKSAPEWANYLAQDRDSEWCWYEARPKITSYYWDDLTNGLMRGLCIHLSNNFNLRQSL